MDGRLFARLRPLLVALLFVALAAACSPTVAPSPSAASDPVAPSPTAGDATPAELAAIEFRRTYGLRAALEHVRAVASNPRSTDDEFGVPLTPEELLGIRVRGDSENVGRVAFERAEAYPDDYCGSYMDHDNGGALVSMWRDNLDGHRAAILFQVGPDANVGFVGCTYAKTYLDRIQNQIGHDLDWLAEIPAEALELGSHTKENRMFMAISSAARGAAERVRQHYETALDLPAGLLTVTSDGTGATLVPWGAVDVTIVGPDGPFGEREILRYELSPGWETTSPGLRCGRGDLGVGFSNLPCQAGDWTIYVLQRVGDDGESRQLAKGRVTVEANKTAKLTIRLAEVPDVP